MGEGTKRDGVLGCEARGYTVAQGKEVGFGVGAVLVGEVGVVEVAGCGWEVER